MGGKLTQNRKEWIKQSKSNKIKWRKSLARRQQRSRLKAQKKPVRPPNELAKQRNGPANLLYNPAKQRKCQRNPQRSRKIERQNERINQSISISTMSSLHWTSAFAYYHFLFWGSKIVFFSLHEFSTQLMNQKTHYWFGRKQIIWNSVYYEPTTSS